MKKTIFQQSNRTWLDRHARRHVRGKQRLHETAATATASAWRMFMLSWALDTNHKVGVYVAARTKAISAAPSDADIVAVAQAGARQKGNNAHGGFLHV